MLMLEKRHGFSYLYSTIMKLTASILLFWFSLLTIQPAVAAACKAMQSTESCCKKKSTARKDCCTKDTSKKKENKPCKENDKDCCSGGLCIPCSICSCCFTATVEKEAFSFARNSERTSLTIIQNLNFLSGFTSQCFQPPE